MLRGLCYNEMWLSDEGRSTDKLCLILMELFPQQPNYHILGERWNCVTGTSLMLIPNTSVASGACLWNSTHKKLLKLWQRSHNVHMIFKKKSIAIISVAGQPYYLRLSEKCQPAESDQPGNAPNIESILIGGSDCRHIPSNLWCKLHLSRQYNFSITQM